MRVILLFVVITLLTGCQLLQERDKREGAFVVNADCEEDTVEVEFKLDQHAEGNKAEIKR